MAPSMISLHSMPLFTTSWIRNLAATKYVPWAVKWEVYHDETHEKSCTVTEYCLNSACTEDLKCLEAGVVYGEATQRPAKVHRRSSALR